MKKFQNKYRISSHRKPNWDYSEDAMYYLTIVTQNRECNLGEIILTNGVNNNPVETQGVHTNVVETHGVHTNVVETHGVHTNVVETHGRASLQPTMILSDFGKIVESEWYKSFDIRDELFLDEFIIMPNHIHAIVILNNQNRINHIGDGGNDARGGNGAHVSTSPIESTSPLIHPPSTLDTNNLISIKRNPAIRLPESISSFMAGFKSSVNTQIDNYIDEHKLKIPKYNKNNHFFQPNYHDHIIRDNREYYFIKNYIINNPQKWETDKLKK